MTVHLCYDSSCDSSPLLQDRVSFPRVLDVAPFLAETRAAAAAAAAAQAGAPGGGAAFGRGGASILMRGHSAVQSAVGGVGALNYELYAILVQSGGVAGPSVWVDASLPPHWVATSRTSRRPNGKQQWEPILTS